MGGGKRLMRVLGFGEMSLKSMLRKGDNKHERCFKPNRI